jgi:hypothetical protein
MPNPRWVEALSTEKKLKTKRSFLPRVPVHWENNAASRYAGYVGKRYEPTPVQVCSRKPQARTNFGEKFKTTAVFLPDFKAKKTT